MAYAMGTRVRFNQVDETGVSTWECGQILGVHDEGTFDVFLSTGEGKMNVAPDQLKIDETAVSETFTSSSAAMAQPKAKTTSIGWNPGAFGDEGDDVEEEEAPAPAPAPKSSGGFAFAVGDRCEIKDYQTKSYRASKLTEVDEDIGTGERAKRASLEDDEHTRDESSEIATDIMATSTTKLVHPICLAC